MANKISRKKAKRSTKKKDSAAPDRSEIRVPEGFKAVSGSFAPTWNPAENEDQPQELQGTWGKERAVSIRRGRGMQEQRVCNVQTKNEVWTIWASAGLVALFDNAEEGDEVYIRYDGLAEKKKKGQSPAKLFTTAIAE